MTDPVDPPAPAPAPPPAPQPTPLELAQARLGQYLAAEAAILSGAQSYQVGDGATARMLTRADLGAIQRGIADARGQVYLLQRGRAGRVAYLR